MKILAISDIHMEYEPQYVNNISRDVAVLAGDINQGIHARHFIAQQLEYGDVVYILGNHEGYGHIWEDVVEYWDSKTFDSSKGKFHFLYDKSVIIDNVRFLGSTLWTDFNRGNPVLMEQARMGMNDYKNIRKNAFEFLMPEDTMNMHNDSVAFLDKNLSESHDGPTIVITHHLPSYMSVNPKYLRTMHQNLNAAFASELFNLIETHQPNYWIHGHTHDSCNYNINKTNVICNPRGYYNEINPDFKDDLIIDMQG